MSEGDYGSPDGSHALTRGAHHDGNQGASSRKGPRFSWTPAYEATFFRSLCESVQLGLKDNHSFKQEAWDRAAQALQERHGAYPNKGHLINKSDNARKKFRLWRGLREDPDFLYNPVTKTVTGSEEAWRAHIEWIARMALIVYELLQKEPLSRSLRGRPFEHEDFMEILFPDVIGSGGAPKRVTKPRRKGPDALPGSDETDTPGTAILDLLTDPNDSYQQVVQNPAMQQLRSTQGQAAPTAPMVPALPTVAGSQRPTSTILPPRTSIASTSALTPPEENAPHTRKRFLPSDSTAVAGAAPTDKRRRTTMGGTSTTGASNNYIDLTHHQQQQQQQQQQQHQQQLHHAAGASSRQHPMEDTMLASLADALRGRVAGPRWSEQAMEMFFREFADEDMDLQVKIAEKALTDPNKAMMFCLMPVTLRKHWVKRLREVHNRIA